jgi:hypothetical protein
MDPPISSDSNISTFPNTFRWFCALRMPPDHYMMTYGLKCQMSPYSTHEHYRNQIGDPTKSHQRIRAGCRKKKNWFHTVKFDVWWRMVTRCTEKNPSKLLRAHSNFAKAILEVSWSSGTTLDMTWPLFAVLCSRTSTYARAPSQRCNFGGRTPPPRRSSFSP